MKHKKPRNGKKNLGRGCIMPLTDWLLPEKDLLERIETVLSMLEAEEYKRWVHDLFPMSSDYNRSIPVEEVARKAGVSPKRILDLVATHKRNLKFKRVKCKTRSKHGWCLRHEDYAHGVSLTNPRLVELASELRAIRKRIQNCMEGPVILVLEHDMYMYRRSKCGLNEEDIVRLITRVAIIAEELGISEDRVREWLGLGRKKTTFYLDNGKKVVLESVAR